MRYLMSGVVCTGSPNTVSTPVQQNPRIFSAGGTDKSADRAAPPKMDRALAELPAC